MFRYIVRRLLGSVAVVWGVSVLIFTIILLTPGDPATAQLGALATQEQLERVREAMGLNLPPPVRYLTWVGNALRGDFGTSYQHRIPAFGIVMDRFPNTITLASCALAVSVAIGLTIGMVAGARPNTPLDRAVTVIGIVAASIPAFWLGIVLLIAFSVWLRWLPAVGMCEVRGGCDLADRLRHLILPTITAAAVPMAVISRMTRSAVIDVFNQDYVRTARAKGLAERFVMWRHVFRNALPNFITIVGLQAGYLLGGSLITEVVFSWPGMGSQLYTSIGARDVPVIMTITLLIALVFTSLNLIVDILNGVVDPRIRFA